MYDELARRLAPYVELSKDEQERIHDVVRTPLFVTRYFDIRERSGEATLKEAFDTRDLSGIVLGEKIDAFFEVHCSPVLAA